MEVVLCEGGLVWRWSCVEVVLNGGGLDLGGGGDGALLILSTGTGSGYSTHVSQTPAVSRHRRPQRRKQNEYHHYCHYYHYYYHYYTCLTALRHFLVFSILVTPWYSSRVSKVCLSSISRLIHTKLKHELWLK